MARLTKLLEVVSGILGRRTAPTSAEPASTSTGRRPAPGARATGPSAGGIEFAYEPRADGDADPGEVVWSWVAFEEDATRGKDRPVVIVGYWGDDLAGVPLTSKARPGDPDRVLVGTGGWDSQGRSSYADLERVVRVRRSAVRREGATLERARFTTLVDALRARA